MKNLALLITLVACFSAADAQQYPNKPIRFVVPYPSGGGTDAIVRPIIPGLATVVGQQIILENRGGAATTVGAAAAAKAAPDGYTFLVCGNGTHAISPHLYSNLTYDPLKDFEPVTLMALAPTVLFAYNGFPFSTVSALIEGARANPEKYTHAAAIGSPPHFSAEIFMSMTGIRLVQVSYKGGGDAAADLLSGRVDMKFGSAPEAIPPVRSGRLKALAVAADSRWPDLPDVPTFREAGLPNYKTGTWYGICAPAKTSAAIIDHIHKAVNSALSSSELRDKLRSAGAATSGMPPKEFGAFIRAEHETYGQIIRALKLKGE